MWVLPAPSSRPLLGPELTLDLSDTFRGCSGGGCQKQWRCQAGARRLLREVESVCGARGCERPWPLLNYAPVILAEGSPAFCPLLQFPPANPQLPGGRPSFSS